MPWLLASESEPIIVNSTIRTQANLSDDRVKLPSDPTRTVKGVDVLPFVMSPLMGPEEYDMDVSFPLFLRTYREADEKEMDKLPATLQFLGTEKKREQDTVLRMMCVEILLLLSTSMSSTSIVAELMRSIYRSTEYER